MRVKEESSLKEKKSKLAVGGYLETENQSPSWHVAAIELEALGAHPKLIAVAEQEYAGTQVSLLYHVADRHVRKCSQLDVICKFNKFTFYSVICVAAENIE